MMTAYSCSWSFALYLCVFGAYTSEYLLKTSSDKATTGIDFNFTCYFPSIDYILSISKDYAPQCSFRSNCRMYQYNENYTCTCSDTIITLTIPGSFDIDTLHGSQWMCEDYFFGGNANTLLLNVNGHSCLICNPTSLFSYYKALKNSVSEYKTSLFGTTTNVHRLNVINHSRIPITQVKLKAIPNDMNPTDILSGSSQQFTCTTDEGRPSSRIHWYMAGVNITDDVVVKPDTCNQGCNGKVLSSSVLIYIGHITDIGKTIYCTASNLDETSVRSQDKMLNILFKPVISEIPDYNITEGSNLNIAPTINANPDPISVWWTRQNKPEFILHGTSLTIRGIQRVSSDNYTCHAMNTITAQGHPTKNRTSQEIFNVNVQFLQRHGDAVNDTAVGVGTGIAVTIFIIGVTILNIFLFRKRRLSKKKEQSISEVYETEFHLPRQTQQTDTHLYNDLGDLNTNAIQQQKSPDRSSNCYEDVGEGNSNTAGYVYENLNISDNEKQIHHRDPSLYVNMDL